MDELVTLVGGPFDGQSFFVERERTVWTIEYRDDETAARDYHGNELMVPVIKLAQYRRQGSRFVHVPVQTAMGESSPGWPEE